MTRRRPSLVSPKLREKKRKRLIGIYAISGGTLLILFFLFAYLSGISSFKIQGVKVEGNSAVSTQELENFASGFLSGRYAGLFSKANVILYPKSTIKEAVVLNWKRVASVEASLAEPRMLKLIVTEREASALWCTSESIDKKDEDAKCYFLEKDGYVFASAPAFTGAVFTRFYGYFSEEESPIGKTYLDAGQFEGLKGFAEALPRLNLNPVHVVYTKDGEYEAHLQNGGKLIFNAKQEFAATLQNLESALAESALGLQNKDKLVIEYIDLRYGNKIFYKLKTQE